MKIGDISVADVLAGKNWRFVPPEDAGFEAPMEEWEGVQEAARFKAEDQVLYSAIDVTASAVRPILMLKEVGDCEQGGDCCEYKEGRWRQIGLEPNEHAEDGEQYVANPLSADESFLDAEDRKEHRQGFEANVGRVSLTDGGVGETSAKPKKTSGRASKPAGWLMSRQQIADAGVAELVAAFREAAVARDVEWRDGSVSKGNKLEDYRGAICDELRQRGEDAQRALLPLLNDPHLGVRWSAASEALRFEPKKAVRALKKVSRTNTGDSLRADMILVMWRRGDLVFQKETGLAGADKE